MADEQAIQPCPACGSVEPCECSTEVVNEALARQAAGADPLVDASNPKQTASMAREKRRREQEAKDDLGWLMRHPQGRRIMWALLERAGIFRNAFVLAEGQTNQTNFHLGAQNMGLNYFVEVMTQEPDGYNLMIKENSGRMAA